jgi:hypothetical protein
MANEYTIGQSLRALADANSLSTDEIDFVDGVTAGTAASSKAVVLDANGDVATIGALTAVTLTATDLIGSLTYTTVARTATADGTGTGTIADAGLLQFVTVTSASADNIVVLPTPTPGTIVLLAVGANGFELRTDTPASVAINGGSDTAAESAIAASSLVIMVCTSATTWQGIDLAATTLAAVEAAAAP